MTSTRTSLRGRVAAGTAFVGAFVALAGGAPAAQASVADYLIYPPGIPPVGKPVSEHQANFWKLVLAQPEPNNPITDTTGEDVDNGQSGNTWYLAGSFPGEGPITRTATIPRGKTLVIPVANGLAAAFVDDPPAQRTEAYLRAQVEPVKNTTNLKASIDGSPITTLSRYFGRSKVFSSTLPANNLYGLDAGTLLSPAVDAGYYISLYPLLPGNHTVKISSGTGADAIDVTYKLKVV